jgi:hypothetical protein
MGKRGASKHFVSKQNKARRGRSPSSDRPKIIVLGRRGEGRGWMDGWRMMMMMNFAASAFHSPLMSGLMRRELMRDGLRGTDEWKL